MTSKHTHKKHMAFLEIKDVSGKVVFISRSIDSKVPNTNSPGYMIASRESESEDKDTVVTSFPIGRAEGSKTFRYPDDYMGIGLAWEYIETKVQTGQVSINYVDPNIFGDFSIIVDGLEYQGVYNF
ncbi:hypothetical protein SB766_14680 [Pseudomonas sp. SIMBA_077]